MAKSYPLMQVDAFTSQPLSGNPCAVLFDTDDLSDAVMQAIAREMNLSETAFVRQSTLADFGVRYFTPAEEIPLAGHPTLATARALVDSGRLALTSTHTRLVLELTVGSISVDLHAPQGRLERITMEQKKPQFLDILPPEQAAPVFGLSPADLVPGCPVQIVSTGTPQLMLAVSSLEALAKAQVDPGAYLALRQRAGFFSPHLFCLQGATPAGRTFARHFGVPPDSPEDPFTGSATGGMAAYLWHYGLIDSPSFTAEQGHWMDRPGQGYVEVIGPPGDIKTVKVGGSAVTVLRGQLTL